MTFTCKQTPISNFLRTDFRSFSTYDCEINIPSLTDGWKVSQRKAVYGIVSGNKKSTVERFSSEVAAVTCYHHGATNLAGVIIGMTQTFTGSNNVNWFNGIGQFGNILNHSSASPRYISVEPHENFRKWFKREDDCILEYEFEDGVQIEPKYYIPIVPTILFNGSNGIGTGYSCKIMQYNPDSVVENVKLALNRKPLTRMVPWFNGFTGTVERTSDDQIIITGSFERVNTTTLRITALPAGVELDSYKVVLGKLIDSGDIRDYDDSSTDTEWSITIYSNRAFVSKTDEELINKLGLVAKHRETITVWDENHKIKRFSSPEQLVEHFVNWRLTKYEARRVKQIEILNRELDWAREKIRFIRYYIDNSQWFSQATKKQIEAKLNGEKFTRVSDLLQIRVYNLTRDAIEQLEKEIVKTEREVTRLEKTTPKDMYLHDLG